jgi:glutamate synthase domain-containing protein 1
VGSGAGSPPPRDPIACKPAVLAETDDWVAMASEWRSIATLPGAAEARSWEPVPGVVYAWERAKV